MLEKHTQYTELNLANQHALIKTNLETLKEGKEFLENLREGLYRESVKPIFHSTLGAHFRHMIEHYQCFFVQLEQCHFCYDERRRNQILEEDSRVAVDALSQLINQFEQFDFNRFNDTYTICDDQTLHTVETNVERELLFLQSHTVHHYALIAAIVRALGETTQDDFGVAIATRNFNNQTSDDSEVKSCAQ